MNSVWSQFTGGFVSFLKHVGSPMTDTEAAASAVEAWSAKIADWAISLMGFYFAAAVAIAVGSVQYDFPFMFQFLSLSILLGFSSLLLAVFVKFKSPLPTQILHCLGFFPMVCAFFVAVSIPYQIHFKIISSIAFVVVNLVIFCFATIPGT